MVVRYKEDYKLQDKTAVAQRVEIIAQNKLHVTIGLTISKLVFCEYPTPIHFTYLHAHLFYTWLSSCRLYSNVALSSTIFFCFYRIRVSFVLTGVFSGVLRAQWVEVTVYGTMERQPALFALGGAHQYA